MKPEMIIMLTYNDQTVKNAMEVFNECKDLPVKCWGFKDVGLPIPQMKELVAEMKKNNKTTFMEVVSYTEEECLAGAKLAIECGFDYLMGTIFYDSVFKLFENSSTKYLPFCGKVSGSPSILEGTIDEIIDEAKKMTDKGVGGFDILAYRYVQGNPEELAQRFVEETEVPVCVAGSISSFDRLDKVKEIAPWSFTIGSAFFDKKFVPNGSFREQIEKVIEYMG
ncbi:hypothetical protein [Petroclostridium sp. X23]|uniref:hypothetical protein n=1 Tax=Petroclostridium sp. X23 TaxID=3045146 RepID=UPI0024AE0DED|nr:hypothetical protein [Petroclostridium sp. X23]WHH60485.1 hypothetical protein QKW49_07190 [Petroclostridium sp. X23]